MSQSKGRLIKKIQNEKANEFEPKDSSSLETPEPKKEPTEKNVGIYQEIPSDHYDAAFLDNLAHQLVAPLQSVVMHCQMIIDDEVPQDKIKLRLKEVVGHAKMISDLALRMRFLHDLVWRSEDIVYVGRVEFNRITSQFIAVFNNYLHILSEKIIHVDIDYENMNLLPDVQSELLATQQVIMNLFDNASKYSHNDCKISINGIVRGKFVVVTFRHPGIRINDDEKERIFERGYRGSGAQKVRAAGTGIGLWVSRKLMQAMGGNLICIPSGHEGETEFRMSWKIAK